MTKSACLIVFGSLLLSPLVLTARAQSGESLSVENECPPLHMRCADGTGCVRLDYRCDGDNDCLDGSDESVNLCSNNCLSLQDRFQCADGTCIRGRHVCTGTTECRDGSDEDTNLCSDCNGNRNYFKCGNSNKCIPRYYTCDSSFNCGDFDTSDEDPSLCENSCDGNEGRFQCDNKQQCVHSWTTCNGRNDCKDGSDESDELCANCHGLTAKTKCKLSNRCVREMDLCDGNNDCNIWSEQGLTIETEDGTDEETCPEIPAPKKIYLG